jgi:chemotaxis protein CheD
MARRAGSHADDATAGTNRYWDARDQAWVVQILPGELRVTTEDELLVTVLGSCVAVCARDPIAGVGGLNHFMLPDLPKDAPPSPRYGRTACEQLLAALAAHGARPERLELKLYGGGAVISSSLQVGMVNVEYAHQFFASRGLAILAEDVGDQYARRIRYRVRTGEVQVKPLPRRETAEVIQGERALRESLAALPPKR